MNLKISLNHKLGTARTFAVALELSLIEGGSKWECRSARSPRSRA